MRQYLGHSPWRLRPTARELKPCLILKNFLFICASEYPSEALFFMFILEFFGSIGLIFTCLGISIASYLSSYFQNLGA